MWKNSIRFCLFPGGNRIVKIIIQSKINLLPSEVDIGKVPSVWPFYNAVYAGLGIFVDLSVHPRFHRGEGRTVHLGNAVDDINLFFHVTGAVGAPKNRVGARYVCKSDFNGFSALRADRLAPQG